MLIIGTTDRQWMKQCAAVLLADGIEPRWSSPLGSNAAFLDVAVSDGERVAELLSEQLGEELHRPAPIVIDKTPLLRRPEFAVALGSAVLLLAFHWVTGPFDPRVDWFGRGALFTDAAYLGEWWRMLTAATLHSDAGHAIGNAGFFVILGWGVGERLGGGVMLLIAVLTAVAGFVVSLLFADATATVGASGGLFGLLGAAGGHGMRELSTLTHAAARRHGMRVFGAAVMLLAFTAFGPTANIQAHIGGFVAGLGIGVLAPRHAPGRVGQIIAASAAAALLALGWVLALRSG